MIVTAFGYVYSYSVRPGATNSHPNQQVGQLFTSTGQKACVNR